tara:strand:- start:3281 stop:3943 length:663 start_codon:yes stop_codon:yes gene_type:complete
MTDINFSITSFKLHKSGILFWPEKKIAVASDLHLEKSSSFAKLGIFLPPYESLLTLDRLYKILKKSDIKRLILLGDTFHDNYGYLRLSRESRKKFEYIISKYDTTFILGNHDRNIQIPMVKKVLNLKINEINFCHELSSSNFYEISGHYHPKVVFKKFNNRISSKCFVISKSKIILPAFGEFTGGLDVNDKAFKSLIKEDCDYFLLHPKKLYHLPQQYIR